MRTSRTFLAAALLIASLATGAVAQTPTPWLPAATPAPNTDVVPRGPLYRTLLSAATATNASAGAYVAGYGPKQVQVDVGTCGGSYTLVIEGSLDGVKWAGTALQSISNSDFGANVTGLSNVFTQPIRFIRTRLSAVSSCSVSTALAANPQ